MEGRTITCHFKTFILVATYVPNSGVKGLNRLEYRINSWDKDFHHFLKEELEAEHKKPVILTGDLNVAHHEIDIYAARGHERQAGFTREERESFGTFLETSDMVDTFRHFKGSNRRQFSFWN